MEDFELLAEPDEIERLLTQRQRSLPSAALRERVLADFRSELHGRRLRSHRRRLVGLAAVLFLGFSMMAAHAAGFAMPRADAASPLHDLAVQIQRLTPDISPEEAVRRAMLVEIASRVGCRSSLGDQLDANNAPYTIERAVR